MTTDHIDAATLDEDFAAVSEMFGTDIRDPHSLYREYRQTQPVMEGDILARFNVPSQADYSNLGRVCGWTRMLRRPPSSARNCAAPARST